MSVTSTTVFSDQAIFMRACGQSVGTFNLVQAHMYLDLIREELRELEHAKATDDIVEQADACIDLIVVAIGFGHSLGLPMQSLWKEVVRSNMSKVSEDGSVKRREDGKILKPLTFSPPDIRGVMKSHGWFSHEESE